MGQMHRQWFPQTYLTRNVDRPGRLQKNMVDINTRLAEAFGAVESSISGTFPQSPSDAWTVLGQIAILNTELGKAAASHPQYLPELRALQFKFNEITRSVKKGKSREAKTALAEARRMLNLFLASH